MIKGIWLFLILVLSMALGYYCKADNIGLDYGFGPNQTPSYGLDYTKTYEFLYINPQIMFNNDVIIPSISSGLQIDYLSLGFVLEETRQSNGASVGSSGVEMGFTDNLNQTFYMKENNQLLRDQNNVGNFGITLSAGINF